MTEKIQAMATMFQDIKDFHRKFGLEYDGPPRDLPEDLSSFRKRFMEEELEEYCVADDGASLEGMFDALIDLVYVALGTAYLHGFDFAEGWRRVHEANMAKVRALRESDSARGSVYDVVKPAGWMPPDLSDLVR